MKALVIALALGSSMVMAAPIDVALQMQQNPNMKDVKVSDPPVIVKDKDGKKYEVSSVFDPKCQCVKKEKKELK